MEKDFDSWNRVKKETDTHESIYFRVREGEVWWCKLGLNIGVEIDGKNDKYQRPVLIIRRFNEKMFLAMPLTTKFKVDIYHHKLVRSRDSRVVLSQVRIISAKRLTRKIFSIDPKELAIVKDKFKSLI
jgi:mRNA interferase MazF